MGSWYTLTGLWERVQVGISLYVQTEALRSRADTHRQTLPITCVCLSGGPSSFALYENNERHQSTQGRPRSGCHRAARLEPGGAFLHSSDSFSLRAELLGCRKSPEIKAGFVSEGGKWFPIPNESNIRDLSNYFPIFFSNSYFIYNVRMTDVRQHTVSGQSCHLNDADSAIYQSSS